MKKTVADYESKIELLIKEIASLKTVISTHINTINLRDETIT